MKDELRGIYPLRGLEGAESALRSCNVSNKVMKLANCSLPTPDLEMVSIATIFKRLLK